MTFPLIFDFFLLSNSSPCGRLYPCWALNKHFSYIGVLVEEFEHCDFANSIIIFTKLKFLANKSHNKFRVKGRIQIAAVFVNLNIRMMGYFRSC